LEPSDDIAPALRKEKPVLDSLVINENDNTATALCDIRLGQARTSSAEVSVRENIPRGHKFAISDIAKGEPVVKYGQIIGIATADIERGALVHVHNVSDPLAHDGQADGHRRRPAPLRALAPREPTWDIAELRSRTFLGYKRAIGRAGVRNQVAVVATVGCSKFVVERIGAETGATTVTHEQGCLQLGKDLELTERQLRGVIRNPNVGAVLLVGLGCEAVGPASLDGANAGKPVHQIGIQDLGGTRAAIATGIKETHELQRELGMIERIRMPISQLLVGTKCGGSDGLSGLTANPALGVAADMLIDAGASVLLSETPGLFGSEALLQDRMDNEQDRERLSAALDRVWSDSLAVGQRISEGEMSPGNVEGGLTTLVEKSLGANVKCGTRRFEGFLEMAEEPRGAGLWLMDTPGVDVLTISVQAAGGAQIICFTTGRGSPVGNALAPVVKISSNSSIAARMADDIDFDAGQVADGRLTMDEAGRSIFELVIATASGEATSSELLGHREFGLAHLGSTL